jgi:hypothetical protein
MMSRKLRSMRKRRKPKLRPRPRLKLKHLHCSRKKRLVSRPNRRQRLSV